MSTKKPELDLAGGDVPLEAKKLSERVMKQETWRFRWTQIVAVLAATSVTIFYTALIWFIFFGGVRNNYLGLCVDDISKLVFTDIPVILVLSTVPTIVLITLLRYYRPTPREERSSDPKEEDFSSIIAVQACKEILNATDQKP